MSPTPCATAHNGEFAGVYDAPDGPWPTDAATAGTARLDGCRAVVASFAGIPNDTNFQYRTGQIVTPFTEADWEMGNRGVLLALDQQQDVHHFAQGRRRQRPADQLQMSASEHAGLANGSP